MRSLSSFQAVRLIGVGILCFAALASGQDAKTFASQLSAAIEDGDSLTRMKLQSSGSGGEQTLQLQVKARRSAGRTEVLYQVLWPNSQKGSAVLLRQSNGGTPEGFVSTSPQNVKALGKAQMLESVFGSDLVYQDLVENFFRWENQAIIGKEKVNLNECVILESKPGSGDSTPYGSVKSWVDPKRMATLRVEKYNGSGNLVSRIEAKSVIKDDRKRSIPTNLKIRRTGRGTTEIDGSNIRHDVKYTDGDFTKETMSELKVSR